MTLADAREELLAQARLDVNLYKGLTLTEEGNYVEEAAGATDLISRACIWWSKLTYCNYDDSVSLTLTVNQTTPYDCRDLDVVSKRILRPRTVTINGTTLTRRDGLEYGLWTYAEFQRHYPTYRTDSSGQPRIAVWLPGDKLRLYPKTDSAYTSYIEGWTIPDDLVNGEDDNEELPVPSEDHQAVVRLAVSFGTLPNASEEEAWRRMSANDNWWREQAERRSRENRNAFLGRKTRGSCPDWR